MDGDHILNGEKVMFLLEVILTLKKEKKKEELISTFTLESVSFPSICYTICKNKTIVSI